MRIKGAVFDLDGTLLNTMSIWHTIGADYLLSRGIMPRENLGVTFKDLSFYQAACYYQSEYGLTESTDEIIAGVTRLMESTYLDQAAPKDGVETVLLRFKSQGVKMCVTTANEKPLAEAALEHCGLLHYFSKVLTCGEIGHGKDEPQIYEAARSLLGTKKEHTYVFEDALYAVRSAKAAGYPVVGVCDPSEDCPEEVKNLADYYIHSFLEMEAVL